MSQICNSCCQKQDLINKYTKLIKLLKTKYEKSSKSTLKSQNFSTQSILQSFGSNAKESSLNIGPEMFDSYKEPTVSIMNEQKRQCSKLTVIVICNKVKKALLKQCFDKVKSAVKISKFTGLISFEANKFPIGDPTSMLSLIEETLNNGKAFQSQDPNPVMTLKSLYTSTFSLENLNLQLRQKVNTLQVDLKESEKRFYKQTEKKRQSLEAVAQEIRQKNDFISDLQHTIKQYQKLSGKSFKKIHVQNILIEDQLELKKTSLRLEAINEKLNYELRNAQNKISQLNSQIMVLKKQNSSLKTQHSVSREHNFDLLNQVNKIHDLTQNYSSLCQKLNKKIQKIKFSEKKGIESLKLNSKGCEIFSSGDLFSFKNTEASSDLSPLSRKSSYRQLQAEQKLESIFSFIFSIQEEGYQMTNEEMFDEDELKLLKLHKNSYLNSVHNQNPQTKHRTQKINKNSNLNETDEIFYIPQPKANLQNSFFNALESQSNFNSKQNSVSNNLKLMDLEIQKSKLIQKISDLKKFNMHIRDVLLKFLKTIEFTNLKPESLRILEIIFDVFEYSEDEKSSLLKEKKKKLWGIL